jgi:hypothetical protein
VGSVQKDHTILLLRIFSLSLFLSVSLGKIKYKTKAPLRFVMYMVNLINAE